MYGLTLFNRRVISPVDILNHLMLNDFSALFKPVD